MDHIVDRKSYQPNAMQRTIPLSILFGFVLWSYPTTGHPQELDSLIDLANRTTVTHSIADTGLAKLQTWLAAERSKAGDMDSAFVHVLKAIGLLEPLLKEHASDTNIHQLLAVANRHGGRLRYFDSQYDESLRYMQAANEHATLANDSVELGKSIMYMAFCFREMNDHAQAVAYTRKAIDVLALTDGRTELGTAYMGMGGIYTNMERTDSALHYFNRALLVFNSTGAKSQISAALLNIASLFNTIGQHDSVHQYLTLAEPFAASMSPPSQVRYRGMLGRDLVIRKEFAKGLAELTIAEEMAEGNPADLAEILHVKALAYAGLHRMPEAMATMRSGYDAMVQDLDLEKVQAVTEQRMAFEQEQEARIASDRIADEQQRKRTAYAGIAMLALLVILASTLAWSRTRNARVLRSKNEDLLSTQEELIRSEKKREAEQVRTRIARDIHDEMGGELTKIRLLGGEVKHLLRTDPEGADQAVERISHSAQQASDALHDIVWATDPHYDTSKGLVDHARNLTERMMERSGLKVTMDFLHHGEDRQVDTVWKQHLLRILKEALHNVVKHAHATAVEISLSVAPEEFTLRVQDNGSGFDSAVYASGNGLRNMKARATAMGADLGMSGAEEGGCTLALHGPVSVAAYH
jgi:signal transduction histidine kinase/tetratricopeptide (TPR) repeat protein